MTRWSRADATKQVFVRGACAARVSPTGLMDQGDSVEPTISPGKPTSLLSTAFELVVRYNDIPRFYMRASPAQLFNNTTKHVPRVE